ncbi:protein DETOXIFICATION 49 [Amborella trichopoda]|nr:protein DETOXIFICATION 49 [Amborella trichopoda]|eukprot:XP_006852723.2 protein DETOXIFICATION 49 [Amborella trichopoda]
MVCETGEKRGGIIIMCRQTSPTTTTYISPFQGKHRQSHSQSKFMELEPYDLHRWPSSSEVKEELKAIFKISGPTVLTGLLLYSRAMISMLFLGFLGELELSGGALAIGFANITGYSVMSGLAMGMEPICAQAFGAKQYKLMGLALQRTILLLLTSSLPISVFWFNMKKILLLCGQDEAISSMANTFILFSLPDLVSLSFLHPLRNYLRTQNITLPLTYCSAISVLLHIPVNFLLVTCLKMGIGGVALASVWTNFILVLLLLFYLLVSGAYKSSWASPSTDCFRGWGTLMGLALPTCISVCLEWWWYELMIILCGLFVNPRATVASMGIMIQTTALVYVFPSALSLGVSARVGHELGADRPSHARISMLVGLTFAGFMGVMAMGFAFSVRHWWGRMFSTDPEVLKLTAMVLPIAGLCELGNCPQTTGCGVLRGSARPAAGANINLCCFYCVGLPVALALGFWMKFEFLGLWVGLLAAQGCCAVVMLFVLARTDWVAQVDKARRLTDSKPVAVCDHDGSKDTEPLILSPPPGLV